MIKEQINHYPGGINPAAFLQMLHTCAEHIKTGHAVDRILPKLPGFLFLLFLNAAYTSNQFTFLPVRIVDRIAGKRHPEIIRTIQPFHAKLNINSVFPALHRLNNRLTVFLINILRIKKAALKIFTIPASAHGLMIDNIQDMIFQIIGKENIL